jgi:nucleoside-diphosphate-sugar epimerase
MNVLIAGGMGFVGLNIAEQVLLQGGRVTLFGPDSAPPAFIDVLKALPGHLEVVSGDVTRRDDLDSVLAGLKPEFVINAAAITAGPEREVNAAHDIFRVNLLGTLELLEACLRHPVKRLVQLGTGSVFGQAGQWSETLDEQRSAVFPDSLYGISKFAAERTCIRYAIRRNVDVTVMRLGTVFGRWEYSTGVRDNLSIPLQLLQAAYRGEQVVLLHECADDWIYSVDVAHGVLAALDVKNRLQPLYHLSAGGRWDVDQWCQKLATAFPAFAYQRVDDPFLCTVGRHASARRSPMGIERITKDIGFKPQYLADRAFEDFVQWGNKHLAKVPKRANE